MKAIWKFPIQPSEICTVKMPKGSEILTVQTQYGAPVLWALVDPKAEITERHFEVFGTGHNIVVEKDITRKYIGTFQLEEGSLVFHLFERFSAITLTITHHNGTGYTGAPKEDYKIIH